VTQVAVRPITRRRFATVETGPDSIDQDELSALRLGHGCHELVFINGLFAERLSTPHAALQSLAKAPELASGYLNRNVDPAASAFAALNTAFMADGGLLCVPDDTIIESPINLMFLSTPRDASFVSHPRNILVLGRNSSAVVIESYIGLRDAEYFTNAVTEVFLGPGSKLVHYKVQQESTNAFHVGGMIVKQDRDSRLESHSISLGGALARNDLETTLAAEGAQVVMNGLYMAGGTQHVDNHTKIIHEKPHTRSEEYYRGVLDGRARAVFNGKVIVKENAQKTDAHQSNANLLLSGDAEVDTKPELEIYADDVKCSHGATVGQLDQDMLFYLRSRAIPEETARNLLVFAFAEDVIDRLGFAPVRERLEHQVAGRLPGASLIRDFVK
jgi:Fe-S cluster assembly protein SufD